MYDWKLENPQKDIAEYEKDTGSVINGTGEIFLGEDMPESKKWRGLGTRGGCI